ncbi:MAG TPA: hypothetical protein VEW07_07895 [Solirubrobacterales bacterium]|nr:hypothetical protein [Solirubrobacterales bacterium]
MNSKTKALGLALIAALALSSVSAMAAQANKVTAGKYPAVVTGKDANTEHGKLARLTIGNGARFLECTTVTLGAELTEAATKVTVTPTFSGCFANGLTAVPGTLTMSGCVFTVEATSKATAQAFVTCSAGASIEVHVYENATRHAENVPLCTYDIAAQGPITGAKLGVINGGAANEGISVNLVELGKFNVTSTKGPLAVCGVNATSGHAATTASLRGEYLLSGKSGGVDTPIMIQ